MSFAHSWICIFVTTPYNAECPDHALLARLTILSYPFVFEFSKYFKEGGDVWLDTTHRALCTYRYLCAVLDYI